MASSPPSNCRVVYEPISGQTWRHLLSSKPSSLIRSAAVVPAGSHGYLLCQPDLLLLFQYDAKQHHVVCLQAFAALRMLTEQKHMQSCTSTTVTQGIQVEITSAFLRVRLACQVAARAVQHAYLSGTHNTAGCTATAGTELGVLFHIQGAHCQQQVGQLRR